MAGKHFKSSSEDAPARPTDFDSPSADGRATGAGSRQGSARTGAGPREDGQPDSWSAGGSSSFSMSETIHADEGYVRVRKRRERKSPARFIVPALIVLVVLAVVGSCGLFAYSAYGVMNDAKEVLAQVETFEDALDEGDAEALRDSASIIQEKASSMAGEVDGVLWTVASVLPVVGTDVSNAIELVGVLDTLSTEALTPLAEQADSLNLGALFSEKTINVELVGQLAELVVDMAPAVSEAAETVADLDEGSIERVNQIVDQVDEALGTLDALCSSLSELAPYVEDMLGANGTRTYLVLAHNTSELKSAGGFIGSVGVLTITNGSFELGDFDSFNEANLGYEYSGDTSNRLDSVTDEEAELFTWTYGINAGDSSVNPDFTSEAALAKEFWETLHPASSIDGVIALDSQVLAYFLGLTGSVTTDDGTVISEENCVEVIGYQIYWDYFADADASVSSTSTNDETDALFSEVAELAFNSIIDNIGQVSITGLADVLSASTGENRLKLWMDDADEQQALENLGVAGSISTDETTAQLGVYLESRVASKLSWWTTLDTVYETKTINGDGTTTYRVTTTIANTITEDEVAQAARYIVGGLEGTMRYDVYLYAPAGGSVANIEVSFDSDESSAKDAAFYTINGLMVGKVQVDIAPSSTAVITYEVTTSASVAETLSVRQTPTAQTADES